MSEDEKQEIELIFTEKYLVLAYNMEISGYT